MAVHHIDGHGPVRGSGRECYLQCWTSLTIPSDSVELAATKRDFRRMRDEFGPSYVALRGDQVDEYSRRVGTADGHQTPLAGLVKYTDAA